MHKALLAKGRRYTQCSPAFMLPGRRMRDACQTHLLAPLVLVLVKQPQRQARQTCAILTLHGMFRDWRVFTQECTANQQLLAR